MKDAFSIDLDIEIPVRDASGQISRVRLGGKAGPASPETAADEVVGRAALPLTDDLRRRFRGTVLARIRDVRDVIETRSELMKSGDKGGLGLSAGDADRAMKIIEDVMKGNGGKARPAAAPPALPKPVAPPPAPKQAPSPPAPSPQKPLPQPRPAPAPAKPAAPKPTPQKPLAPTLPPSPPHPSPLPRGERVAERVSPTPLPPPRPPAPPAPPGAVAASSEMIYEQLADEVMRETGIRLPTEIMRRLEIALVARLKDVRDAQETKDYITRPTSAGGAGLDAAAAERVLASVNVRFSKITQELEKIEREKTLTALKREREDDTRRGELRKADEELSRDELFASITSKSKKFAAAPSTTSVRPAPPHPSTLPRGERVAERVSPARPKVQDVTPTVKLIGPVEELRAMTLADFRKLARDPKEACLKIRDKVNLLESERFEKRAAGVAAWRESEPMRLYAELAGNALEGKAVPQQIQERVAVGKASLTEAEFTAIMELNRILRF